MAGNVTEARAMSIFQQAIVEQKSPFDIDKLADRFKHRNTDWSIPEAFLGVLYSAAFADGGFDKKEIETIKNVVARSRAMAALGPAELAKADTAVNEKLKRSGNAGIAEACSTLPPDMCLPVFAHCVDIMLSDGQLVKPELEFLNNLAKMLDIDEDNSRRVMEVLLLKAQY